MKSQTFSIRINSGIDYFNMQQLREFQNILNNIWADIGTKTVDSFPAYYNYQIQAAHCYSPAISAGIYIDYTSTGGRVDYKDYSGELRSDQKVSRISIGALFEYSFYKYRNFSLALSAKTSYQYSTLTLESLQKVYNDTQTTSFEFNSNGFGLEPGIYAGYTYSYFLIRLEVSYQFSSSGTFTSGQYKLIMPVLNYLELKPEWNSIKIGITVGVYI